MNNLLGSVTKPLSSIGLGKVPGVTALYKYAWQHFGPKGIRMINIDGIKLYVICRDWAVAPTMMFAHVWEPAETAIFKQCIKDGMTVVDAGAYIGYFAILSSNLVGDRGKVYAFEPSPESRELLRKNILINVCDNVEVYSQAVSNKSGYATFHLSTTNSSGNSMFEEYRNTPQIDVAIVTLDEIVGNRKVDFVKMDIEGGEMRALQGMTGLIKNSPNLKMIVEVFPDRLEKAGSSLGEFIGALQDKFKLYVIGRDGTSDEARISDIRDATKVAGSSINLFCDREGRQ